MAFPLSMLCLPLPVPFCVTGLVSVDVSSTFTSEGLFIIIMLIQIGGLGVMTLTSFFAMFFMGNTSLYNQLVVRDMVSSQSLSSLLSTLLYILGFTLAIEAAMPELRDPRVRARTEKYLVR